MTLRRASRLLIALVPLLALTSLPVSPAGATSAQVSVDDFAFSPATVTVGQGQHVTWTFRSTHSTTSDQHFWDSGHRSAGSFMVTFSDAGTFGYHCSIHTDMTGRVRVPLSATGTAKKGWTLRWSSRSSTPSNRRYDVQYRRVGTSTWTNFRSASASRTGHFNPARSASYVVRSRTKNVGVGTSGWSPGLTVKIS